MEDMKQKPARIIADCPKAAYSAIKVECAKRSIPVGVATKLALKLYLELNLTDDELGINAVHTK